MLVSEVLKKKAGHTKAVDISRDATIEDATRAMNLNNISALLILEESGKIEGIITERDIVRGIAGNGGVALGMKIQELMTKEVTTIESTALTHDAMETMLNKHFRHLPVVDSGVIKGVISAGDIVRHRIGVLLKILESVQFIEHD